MYSLYRAWLSMSQSHSQSDQQQSTLPLNLSAPTSSSSTTNVPDVQLQVGPSLTTFSAHRNVLSAHSGFFKAALLNSSGPILVPNIQVDEFSSLLTFMYTGYLDLNLSNIYNILLATHILHMPRALELCRNFLMQAQHQQQPLTNSASTSTSTSSHPLIIKPIPSRKPLPNIPFHHESNTLKDSFNIFNTSSLFKKFHNEEEEREKEVKGKFQIENTNLENSKPSTSTKSTIKTNIKSKNPTSKEKNKRKAIVTPSSSSTTGIATAACPIQEDQRTIVDIACCDGPVRFHRVINKNYGQNFNSSQEPQQEDKLQLQMVTTTTITSSEEEKEKNDQQPGKKRTTEAAINKVMTENILQATTKTPNPNKDDKDTQVTSTPTNNNELYTCLYCNHTFKSQYCYQKHARRHLNPVDPVKIPKSGSTSSSNINIGQEQSSSSQQNNCKREFKLLDMNVQYYPCKTCGSKFPSYYFVHKHRKLCHAEEMADGTNKNNEIVQVKPKGTSSGSAKKFKNDENSNSNSNSNFNSACRKNENEVEQESKVFEFQEVRNNHVVVTSHNVTTSNEESCQSDIIDVEETND